MFRRAFAAPLALLCCALSAESQTVLTADRVLELAERQNPEVLIARARAAQAEGALGAHHPATLATQASLAFALQFQQALRIPYGGECMIVCQKVIALVAGFDELDELLHSTEIIAQVQIAGGLNPGNNNQFF